MFNAGAAILRIGSKIGLPIGVIRVHQRLSTSSGAPFSRPPHHFGRSVSGRKNGGALRYL
jgi:hypothetical protein